MSGKLREASVFLPSQRGSKLITQILHKLYAHIKEWKSFWNKKHYVFWFTFCGLAIWSDIDTCMIWKLMKLPEKKNPQTHEKVNQRENMFLVSSSSLKLINNKNWNCLLVLRFAIWKDQAVSSLFELRKKSSNL